MNTPVQTFASKVSKTYQNAGKSVENFGRNVVRPAARIAGGSVKAFGKAMTGQDDFTKQVSRQAKSKY